MQLSYRGVKYESKPSAIATIPGKVIGRYRGIVLHEQVTLREQVTQSRQ